MNNLVSGLTLSNMMCSWNIAQHDLDVKIRKIEEFLSKDKLVAVSTTYDHKPNKWQQQYPKAVEVSSCSMPLQCLLLNHNSQQPECQPAVVHIVYEQL